MDALTWSERFLTGLSGVDEQHERLVGLINEFGELNSRRASVPREQLEGVVDALAAYARTHFVDEEAFMRGAGLDLRFVTQHEAQHARFLADVQHMRASNFLEAPDTSRVLLRFLLHWLAFHILGTDMQLARQVERVRRGESAEAAFTAEVHEVEGPAALLLGALDDLLRVVAQRNAELTDMNRTLEQRVADRTAALQATQARLAEAEKLASVGQLASGLAHEINNPLAFVSANLNALGEHADALLGVADAAEAALPSLPPAARDTLQQACKAADVDFVRDDLGHLLKETREGVTRVQGIVRDLKDFSKVDGGAVMELDLRSAVEATLKMVPPALREGVRFVTETAGAPRVRCRAATVNQTLLNLVQNGAQAVRDRPDHVGTVTVRAGGDATHAWLEVQDDGVGMTPEVLAHAFEPFFTTRPPGQGLGLGLSAAWSCATAHQGSLTAHSEPGRGSTLRLALPLDGAATEDAPQTFTNAFNARRYQPPAKPSGST